MVLTHLILNGMIKVKGQLGEMAKCLEDPDPRISDLAKLFFKELSTKDNALYNNLQDVISHLSVGKFKVDEESFEKTMRFIFTFIEKVSPVPRSRPLSPGPMTDLMVMGRMSMRLRLIYVYRINKQKRLLRNYVNDSDSRMKRDNGGISHSVYHSYRSNRRGR